MSILPLCLPIDNVSSKHFISYNEKAVVDNKESLS